MFPKFNFSHNAQANMNVGKKKDKPKNGILFSKNSELNVKVQQKSDI